MLVKADLHIHTSLSGDGRSSLEDMLKAAASAGIDAVAVADHDILSVKKEDNPPLIIPACECSTTDGHIIALFIESPVTCLKKYTGRLPSASEAIHEIHALGGIAVWAHPYERHTILNENAIAFADIIETANARASFKNTEANKMARELAYRLGKPCCGGSDAHHLSEVGNAYSEIDCKACTLDCIKEALLSGRTQAVLVRNTPRLKKGISQFEKRRKKGFSPLSYSKDLLYIAYWLLLDFIKER